MLSERMLFWVGFVNSLDILTKFRYENIKKVSWLPTQTFRGILLNFYLYYKTAQLSKNKISKDDLCEALISVV